MFKRMYNEAVIHFTIRPQGPILIKAGDTGSDPTRPDMEFVRTWRGGQRVVYLPGSSLKGVLRAHCERIVRTVEGEGKDHRTLACDPLGKQSCGERLVRVKQRQDLASPQVYHDSCFICQLFGNTALAGHLRTSDAYPTGPVPTEQRDGVAIDRVYGAVAVGPFQYETVSQGEFPTQLLIRNFTVAQLGLLGLALRDLQRGRVGVGFGKSRGLGQVTADFTGLAVRYPTAELGADGLRILGHQTPAGRADELLGLGAFVGGEDGYGLSAGDRVALPPGMRMQTNGWGEVELTLSSAAEIEALWRVAVPAFRQMIGATP
jgi:CRISPR-associated RAMP protein (TIGR02581 family)